MKVNINGHMTKMATMAINRKNLYKSYEVILQNRKTYDFETLPEAPVNGALQSLYNHDPQMTLTYFMACSAEVAYPGSQVSVYRTIGPLVMLQSYKFGSYSSPVFSCIRRAVDVSEEDFLQSLAPSHLPYLEFISNSRSGQDFYFRLVTKFGTITPPLRVYQ